MAWADLLDRINVFPVADGDTGRNLVLSLNPLLRGDLPQQELADKLLLFARGNSGNIAARFFCGFLGAGSLSQLPEAALEGNRLAWEAVPAPRPGTMLSLFDSLCTALAQRPADGSPTWVSAIVDSLEQTVRLTHEQLPRLKSAGVVDAGALGMFIFFDGFLNVLTGQHEAFRSIPRCFGDRLTVDEAWRAGEASAAGCCIDVVMAADQLAPEADHRLRQMGESIVSIRQGGYLKVHMHTAEESAVRESMAEMGEIISWGADDLQDQTERFLCARPASPIHLMTDAAGSVTRRDAARLDLTLLDSYINMGLRSIPETRLDPLEIYSALREGVKVSTAQASNFERHQHYAKVLALHGQALYLCVGSAFTGNYQTVMDWKRQQDPENRLVVLDSGAASGRLGLAVLATASFAATAQQVEAVIAFARQALDRCQEYVFLDRLHYLAAGGRLSRTGAFFGDMLRVKPVVSPMPEGVRKLGVCRSQKDQLSFVRKRLQEQVDQARPFMFMLQYTDNEPWVREVVAAEVRRYVSDPQIIFQPVSLTSGVHMGPGTWGLAFLELP